MNPLVIDAAGAVMGRLASYIAKQALLGKTVVVVNCDKIKVTGSRSSVINETRTAARRGGSSLKGPFLPKYNSEKMFKRTIRGMLSYKQQRGNDAFKRIRCYASTPAEYESMKKITLIKPIKSGAITLAELSTEI
ncbi:MAG TPA: 50S ribosomal protein L13 [Candidatus Nanoarchaeia archaeon]|nr:50S ribosomal protein L13 [Candidatus Nanoarchaeia archaeon]